ncbi:NfeD family protein [Paenibacillus protaetiae]|uniref:Protease n=1 Tax=Paenibacillus protaetiae TaxID=2509456 RepID=A0A4P6EXY9_9BACL|nr:NfeD family protein [Paenibacillus protaetiae]QAY65487.1 protease [Paenibacillus protaetiae]
MEALLWGCLIGGALYAIVFVVFGDGISQAIDGMFEFLSWDGHPWAEPTTIVGGITVFGGAGLLLRQYSSLGALAVIVLALVIAAVVSGALFFLYVRPMKNSENSIAYSLREFTGALAEVITPIPEQGYGEVLVKAGAGYTNQIAASFEGKPIPGGARVVVVEVKEDTLYVSELDLGQIQ